MHYYLILISSAKLSDAQKLPKKSEDEPKLLIQQSQVYLKSFVDGRTEDSIEAGLSHSVVPYAFQSMSSDLDDLEVIIAQEEKESRHFESQVQVRNGLAPYSLVDTFLLLSFG